MLVSTEMLQKITQPVSNFFLHLVQDRGVIQQQDTRTVSPTSQNEGYKLHCQEGEEDDLQPSKKEEGIPDKSICSEETASYCQDSSISSTVSEITLNRCNEFTCIVTATLDVPPNYFDCPSNINLLPAEEHSVREARPFIANQCSEAQILFRYADSSPPHTYNVCDNCKNPLSSSDAHNNICSACILRLNHYEIIEMLENCQ